VRKVIEPPIKRTARLSYITTLNLRGFFEINKVVILVVCVVMSGCAAKMELMKNANGDVKECKVDPWGDIQYQRQVDQCVAAYSKAGYTKL
jgi:hypothetical protein